MSQILARLGPLVPIKRHSELATRRASNRTFKQEEQRLNPSTTQTRNFPYKEEELITEPQSLRKASQAEV